MQSDNFSDIAANVWSRTWEGTLLNAIPLGRGGLLLRGQSFLPTWGVTLSGSCGGEEGSVIDYQVLLITLGVLLCIVALTTVAAIGNKVITGRQESSKRAFLDRLRKSFLLLKTGVPEDREEGMHRIVQALSGKWSEMASQEVSQLELAVRLDVIHALEEEGVIQRCLRQAKSPLKWNRARALRILGELKVPSSVPALLSALEDKDSDVRNVAARSLGRMKLQAAEEALVECLGRHGPSVSARIAAICIEMGPRTAPLLIRSLREGTPKARFWSARNPGRDQGSRATRSLGTRSRTRRTTSAPPRSGRWA